MNIKQKIFKIFNEHKTSAKWGSDGSYDEFFAIDEEDFNDVITDLLKILKEK